MNILDRYKQPTPKFFKIIRNIGLTLAATGGAILTAPVALPSIVITIATYATLIGTVATTVSQAAVVDGDESKQAPKDPPNGL